MTPKEILMADWDTKICLDDSTTDDEESNIEGATSVDEQQNIKLVY